MLVIDLKTGERTSLRGGVCAALGSFDGVHLGHRAVIEAAVKQAGIRGASGVVWCVTSEAKKAAFGGYLTSDEEKLRIFSELSLDYAVFEDFDAVKNLSAEDFVGKYLKKLGCVCVTAGFNFRFGRGACSGVNDLVRLCGNFGLGCVAAEPVKSGGITVSSTGVRSLVENGEVERAAELLGGGFFITAKVSHGRTLGKKLGFPTVNQNFTGEKIIPKHGVYFTLTEIDGKKYPAVSNVGSRPTVGGHICRTETHILDFDRDLYGKTITVYFLKFRRPEMRFQSEKELSEALELDVAAAREYFERF